MKKEHTTKNPLKKLSLQWRLTLIITLLMTVTCVLMYFFISNSAVTGIENLGDYVVKINETDSTPITFNINPNTLFAGLSDQVQETKDLFRTRSIIATAIIILLSSVGTYFISRRALLPLRRLSNEVNKIEAQNLSESLEFQIQTMRFLVLQALLIRCFPDWMMRLRHRSNFLPVPLMS